LYIPYTHKGEKKEAGLTTTRTPNYKEPEKGKRKRKKVK
jgi:ribosomal protein S6E (S10)